MSSPQSRRRRRPTLVRRARGQSIPLIAFMFVVLVAMVGLSVDVGNTFQTERRAVAASNAASLAGMNVYLRRTDSTTDRTVFESILNSLRSNGVAVTDDSKSTLPANRRLQLEAYYLDSQGKLLATHSPRITTEDRKVPPGVAYIQVNLKGTVDTYFARVVNRNTLPVNSTAYAGICPAGEGVYPIGINNKLLQGNRFADPGDRNLDGVKDNGWREITSGNYRGYTAMRIDVQDGPGPGGFSWLRWRDSVPGANGTPTLLTAMTIPGTLAQGFEEATYPLNPVPATYPDRPGTLNAGDYVWGTTGYRSSADGLMDTHISEGTRLVLPIYDSFIGSGSNGRYQVIDFGVFVLLSHGQNKPGNEKFLEFVFLGRDVNQGTACSFSSAPDPAATYDLVGEVQLRPEYGFVPASRDPIQYVVVLDVSGSMSANFAGQCDRTSTSNKPPSGRSYWQCTNGPDGAPVNDNVETGEKYWWNNVNERRIKVAKDALESLVRSTNMNGNAGVYDPNRPQDQMALVWFNHSVQRDKGNITLWGASNFSSAPGDLITAVKNAGTFANDTYRTAGGTNGAAALYRAALAYDKASPTVTFGGKTYKYKRVTIFITDGVSNQFLNKSATDLWGGSSTKATYPSTNTACFVNNVIEIASCQITGDGRTIGGGLTTGSGGVARDMDRPITQAGMVSRQDLQPKGVEVYTIALSNIPDTGLKDSIASFPSYYFSAATLTYTNGRTNVDKIIETINTQVQNGPCTQRSDILDGKPEYRADIPSNQFPTGTYRGLSYPTVGEVRIQNADDGTSYTIPIRADAATGRLTYRRDDVPKGNYRLTAYLYYKHPLDLPSAAPRVYSTILGADQTDPSIGLSIGTGGSTVGLGQEVKVDLKLKLTGDACAK